MRIDIIRNDKIISGFLLVSFVKFLFENLRNIGKTEI